MAPENSRNPKFSLNPSEQNPTAANLEITPGRLDEVAPPTGAEQKRKKSLGKKLLTILTTFAAVTAGGVVAGNTLSHDEKSPNSRSVAVGPATPGPETTTPTPEHTPSPEEKLRLEQQEWEENYQGLKTAENVLSPDMFDRLLATEEEVDTLKTYYNLSDAAGVEEMKSFKTDRVIKARQTAVKLFSDQERLQKIIDGANTRWGTDIQVAGLYIDRQDLLGTPEQAAAKVNNVTANLTYVAAEIQLTPEQTGAGENALSSREVLSLAAAFDTGRHAQQDIIDKYLQTPHLNGKAGEVEIDETSFAYVTRHASMDFAMTERPGDGSNTTPSRFKLPLITTVSEHSFSSNPDTTPAASTHILIPLAGASDTLPATLQNAYIPVLGTRVNLTANKAG